MKKIFLFVALFATMTLSAKNLPFKIAGVRATDENIETLVDQLNAIDNITVNGTISYNESSQILYMEKFYVSINNSEKLMGLEIDEGTWMTIHLIGDNYINCTDTTAVRLGANAHLTLAGSGKLNVMARADGAAAFLLDNRATLNVNYTNLDVFSDNASAFVAEKGEAAIDVILSINNSQVNVSYRYDKVKGYAVENFTKLNIKFSDVEFKPNGNEEKLTALRVDEINETMVNLALENAGEYTFSAADKNYMFNGKPARELKWARDWKDDKNLIEIAGEMNDGSKKEYKWSDAAVHNGSAILRNDTLFLKYMDLGNGNTDGVPAITIYKDKAVTIHLEGENSVTAYNNIAGIFSYHGVNFVGDGSLRVGGYDAGIMMQKGVWAKGEPETPTIVAISEMYGICNASAEPYSGQWSLMVDKGADVSASGKVYALFLNNSNENQGLSLRYGTEIAEPYVPEEVFYAKEVRFATPEWKAPVEIAGRTINSLNYNHLAEVLKATKMDGKGEEPSIIYEKENATLSFSNAKIDLSEPLNGPFLRVGEKLRIYASGENAVEMTDAKEFIHAERDVSIDGNGPEENKLIAYGITWGEMAEEKPYSGTYAYLDGNVNFSVYNVIAAANYFEHAIVGSKGDTHKVYFNHASVAMISSKEATQEIDEMQFYECAIKKPAGAEFSPELKGIALDGKLVANEMIVIRPVEEGIENVQMNNGQCTKVIRDGRLFFQMQDGTIYDATGRKL